MCEPYQLCPQFKTSMKVACTKWTMYTIFKMTKCKLFFRTYSRTTQIKTMLNFFMTTSYWLYNN